MSPPAIYFERSRSMKRRERKRNGKPNRESRAKRKKREEKAAVAVSSFAWYEKED